MKTRQCDHTDLHLTEIGFGTASIGNLYQEVDDETAFKVVQDAYHSGIRYFDTAAEYGHGLAEIRLGQALRTFSRDSWYFLQKWVICFTAKLASSHQKTNSLINYRSFCAMIIVTTALCVVMKMRLCA